jgi:Phospholipase_D-nuclease N-terminal
MFALLSILGVLLLLLLIPFGIACFAFWVWMLIHAIRNDQVTGTTRVLWVALVWFLPLIGSVIYFFTGRKTVGLLRTA